MSTGGSTFELFDLLGDFSETLKHVYDFKIGPMVEEGMKQARSLDRRRSSRIYVSGVTSEKNITMPPK